MRMQHELFESMLIVGRCEEQDYYHCVKWEAVIGHFTASPLTPIIAALAGIPGGLDCHRRVKTHATGNAPNRHHRTVRNELSALESVCVCATETLQCEQSETIPPL